MAIRVHIRTHSHFGGSRPVSALVVQQPFILCPYRKVLTIFSFRAFSGGER